MKLLLLAAAFLLMTPVASADKIPFEYSVSYSNQYADWDYTGFGDDYFEDVPVFISGQSMDFEVTLEAKKDMKDVMIVVFQEYYCVTDPADRTCDSPLVSQMPVPNVTSFHEKVEKGDVIVLGDSLPLSDAFSSLDRTHLIVIHCPGGFCEKHMDKFWDNYYDLYYSENRVNSTVAAGDDWKFFKGGKVIVDDPFAGIWCPVMPQM